MHTKTTYRRNTTCLSLSLTLLLSISTCSLFLNVCAKNVKSKNRWRNTRFSTFPASKYTQRETTCNYIKQIFLTLLPNPPTTKQYSIRCFAVLEMQLMCARNNSKRAFLLFLSIMTPDSKGLLTRNTYTLYSYFFWFSWSEFTNETWPEKIAGRRHTTDGTNFLSLHF